MEHGSGYRVGEFLLWEYPLSYWMEQQGYDMSYIWNMDTHKTA